MTIEQLRTKWESEKRLYSVQEVGSGTQKFVKDILKSEEFFNLKEGLLSTPQEQRKYEFIEEPSRNGNKADVVIFINHDIIIPVEVEKFLNITAGEEQILKYRTDWDKKYGILTDGFTWRFYINNSYKDINLNQMFDDPVIFHVLWENYTREDNYYLFYFNSIVQPQNKNNNRNISVEKNKEIYFEDTTRLINSFKSKLDIAGYFDSEDEISRERKSIEITYAYLIQFILYKVLVDNHFGNFNDDYKQRITSITNSLKNGNSFIDALAKIQGISNSISNKIYRPFHEEQKYISQTLDDIIYAPLNTISDISPWLDILLYISKYDYTNIETDIFGYLYENYLKEQFEDENMGQYFTDPSITQFMLDELGYTKNELSHRLENESNLSIVDPSCGSGTFLYNSVERIISSLKSTQLNSINVHELVLNNIFGFDIAEFPLYLAEMNVVMRLLPYVINEPPKKPLKDKIKIFKTKDSVAEFINIPLYNANTEKPYEQLEFSELLNLDYQSYVRDEDTLKSLKETLIQNENIPRRRFDYVIGNPPYISYNECSKQGLLTFELLRSKKVKLNNIYGVNLHSTPQYRKSYRPNPNLYAFFLALGIALLKDNGKLCYIIPMTMLVNGDLDVIRYHLSHYVTIEKLITFSGKMFINRGINQNTTIPTSSMIIVLKRKTPDLDHEVEIVNYKGNKEIVKDVLFEIKENMNTTVKTIRQQELYENLYDWLFIVRSNHEEYEIMQAYNNMDSITQYSEHRIAAPIFGSNFYFDGGYGIKEREMLLDAPNFGTYYKIPLLNNDYWTIKEFKGYWLNHRSESEEMYIKLRQGSQGYHFLDSKYKIIWQYNNVGNFFFTDQKLIWALNKYVGIGSDNKNEILYLFALLNSQLTSYIIKKKIIIGNEDRRTSLFSLRNMKTLLRIPRITPKHKIIKDYIISLTGQLIENENETLGDCVNLNNVLMQRFTNIKINNGNLILKNGNHEITCSITKKKSIIKKTFSHFTEYPISLTHLKKIPIIDKEKDISLKSYIDDLVFSLYFIDPEEITPYLICPKELRDCCKKYYFYKYLN